MLDIGWSELLLIGVVALIVVGPEDLPRMFHSLGRMVAKVRAMGREFSAAMEDAARESGIKEAAGSLNEVRQLTSKKALGLDALDRAATKFERWEPKLPKAASEPATGPVPDPAAPAAAPAAPQTPAAESVAAPGESSPGRRTLKAVRRSDAKDA